jgi:hypothetical protein
LSRHRSNPTVKNFSSDNIGRRRVVVRNVRSGREWAGGWRAHHNQLLCPPASAISELLRRGGGHNRTQHDGQRLVWSAQNAEPFSTVNLTWTPAVQPAVEPMRPYVIGRTDLAG